MLSAKGHNVVAPLRGTLDGDGLRGLRIRELSKVARVLPEAPFGSEEFLAIARSEACDVLAHHGAHVTDYRNLNFDINDALKQNTLNLRKTLEIMLDAGLQAVVSTGSLFENDTGIGDEPLEAFSPYGLSKALSWQVIRFWCRRLNVPVGRFVIPNPFGPFEEPRFCNYLIQRWANGDTATVATPLYVRDNIHVDLLALAYAEFVERMAEARRDAFSQPSGYAELQGDFARRFAEAMRKRLQLPCELAFGNQTEFPEPRNRINSEPTHTFYVDWSESKAWDQLADYYGQVHKLPLVAALRTTTSD